MYGRLGLTGNTLGCNETYTRSEAQGLTNRESSAYTSTKKPVVTIKKSNLIYHKFCESIFVEQKLMVKYKIFALNSIFGMPIITNSTVDYPTVNSHHSPRRWAEK